MHGLVVSQVNDKGADGGEGGSLSEGRRGGLKRHLWRLGPLQVGRPYDGFAMILPQIM